MFRKYEYQIRNRSHSLIADQDGKTYLPIGKPRAGNTADNRFFGREKNKKFLVKRLKFQSRCHYSEEEIKRINTIHEASYRKEQTIWNLVYPDHQADLFVEDGLRLVLPYLPGETLREALSDDELICCKQLLSVAYAIQKFNQLGFTYHDFNTDNVLIELNAKGEFHAYLIDFNDIGEIRNHVGAYQEIYIITRLIPGCDCNTHFQSSEELIEFLHEKITALQEAKETPRYRPSW